LRDDFLSVNYINYSARGKNHLIFLFAQPQAFSLHIRDNVVLRFFATRADIIFVSC